MDGGHRAGAEPQAKPSAGSQPQAKLAAGSQPQTGMPMPRGVDGTRPTRERFGWLLKHARQRLSALSEAALEPWAISGRELAVLGAVVEGEPSSQLDAALRLGIDRTTMVALIDELEAKGLVERQRDGADGGRNMVVLTKAGRTTFTGASRATDEVERAFLAPLPEPDRHRFREMLRAVSGG